MTRSRPSRPVFTPLAATACALALACEETAPPPSTLPPNAPVETGLQQVLDRAVAKPGLLLPGAITFYRDPDHAPWAGSAGLGETQARVPMRPGDRVRGGSIVKTFLAVVTLQQVEEGKLSLDQTLPALLPPAVTDRVANAEQITLRMLLNHTSGIPEWKTRDVDMRVAENPARIWTPEELLALAAGMPPSFAPGTSWRYSNTNYILVGLVLERAGGASWRAQIRTRVFERLGLAATLLPEPGDRSVTAEYAHGYHEIGGAPIDVSAVDPSMAGAAGGHALVTTVQDLARFLEALLAGQLFARPETLTAMTTMVDAPHESGLPHRYGLGLESFDFAGGTTVVGHAGATGGYAVMMFQLPARKTTLVTAVNVGNLFSNALEVFIPSVDVLRARP